MTIITVAAILLILCAVAWQFFRQLRNNAMKSCILSIPGAVLTDIRRDGLAFAPNSSKGPGRLASEEMKSLMERLMVSRSIDCGSFEKMEQGLDYWGNPITIEIRGNNENASVQVTAISSGPDGLTGTEDDIVAIAKTLE